MFEKLFHLSTLNTDIKTELIGGSTTFMTMAYIIFVQPVVMSVAGMDFGAVLTATCISSAIAILVMGIYANYPVALAPGMGQNFFFTYTVVITMGVPWQKALGAVGIAGIVFILLSTVGFRAKIINAIPEHLKSSIAIGIGLMITLIGLQWAGLIVDDPALLLSLGDLGKPAPLLAIGGFFVTAILLIRHVRGAMLIGILATTIAGYIAGYISYQGIFSMPPSMSATFLKLDMAGLFKPELIEVVFTFLILDLFDTIGTLVGVAKQGGLMKDGKLPRAEKALFADALGTVAGACCGTSTVTSYVESAAGIASGARTGLANLLTAMLFLSALFVYPLVKMIGGGIEGENGVVYYPTIAPVLMLVGIYMIRGIRMIPWEDLSESVPAFVTIIFIPFTFRITEGIGLGFITYVLLKIAGGKWRDIPLLLWFIAVIFILRYLFMFIR